jgi:L-2-hydroxyglutarate oxidase LhgO
MDSEISIIGAGVVGLSIAKSCSKFSNKIFLIDKNNSFGLETSSRNSEVIHSGIYYPINSLKSNLCIAGRKKLYKYCDINKIPYKNCGKLIIAQNQKEKDKLITLKELAFKKGLCNYFLNQEEIKEKEPNIVAKYALFLPQSGIIDSHRYMSTLVRDINDNVDIVYKTKVKKINKIHKGYELIIQNPDKTTSSITTRILINSGGLHSSQISEFVGVKDSDYELSYWKGEYFWVSDIKKNYLKTLIYPIPDKNIEGLGIHSTTDLNGRLKFGPNATYIREPKNFDFSVDIKNKKGFYDAINRYLPSINITQLNPDFSGIRPKLQKPGSNFHDFVITNEESKNFHNFINLIGIESPGLTASLAIGEYVTKIIDWG